MKYEQAAPSGRLAKWIKSFWMVDSEGDDTIHTEKIVPDGYPEMIFHYGDPYRTNISGEWQQQAKNLIGGQLKKYFYLQNTASIGIFAIKFQPWALNVLYNLNMELLTDKVIPIPSDLLSQIKSIREYAISNHSFEEKIFHIEEILSNNISHIPPIKFETIQQAVDYIIERKGSVDLKQLYQEIGISKRTLERKFKLQVGIPPKFYCRVIRLASVFRMVSQPKIDWPEITFKAQFYDQAHFIKNFKEFTGEEPSKYGFTEENLANLFLKAKKK